jgi:hypothetical protein
VAAQRFEPDRAGTGAATGALAGGASGVICDQCKKGPGQ